LFLTIILIFHKPDKPIGQNATVEVGGLWSFLSFSGLTEKQNEVPKTIDVQKFEPNKYKYLYIYQSFLSGRALREETV
jgi:hypothetical protein